MLSGYLQIAAVKNLPVLVAADGLAAVSVWARIAEGGYGF